MASMCAKFHCHTISSLENTRVGHFCSPSPRKKYATQDTPNKIVLKERQCIEKKVVRHINDNLSYSSSDESDEE